MNVRDLEKQATPGALEVYEIKDGEGRPAFVLRPLDGTQQWWAAEVEGYAAEAGAKMLAHCRNNFLAALDALKRDRELFDAIGDTENSRMAADRDLELYAMIKELEEVE